MCEKETESRRHNTVEDENAVRASGGRTRALRAWIVSGEYHHSVEQDGKGEQVMPLFQTGVRKGGGAQVRRTEVVV